MGIFHEFVMFVLPQRTPRERLPLLPLEFTIADAESHTDDPKIFQLRAAAASRSERRARALLREHPEKSVKRIARIERRKRRHQSTLNYAWNRLKSLW